MCWFHMEFHQGPVKGHGSMSYRPIPLTRPKTSYSEQQIKNICLQASLFSGWLHGPSLVGPMIIPKINFLIQEVGCIRVESFQAFTPLLCERSSTRGYMH